MKQKRLKKAQDLSFTVIVIAILALITLAVVLGVFTGKFGKFSKDIESCAVRGGMCKEKVCAENERELDATCPKEKKFCCIKVIG